MSQQHYVVGSFADVESAHRTVEALIEAGCPMDRISALGRLVAEGDDLLGVVHPRVGERMEVWGAKGAIWGAIGGALAGAAGAFWLPVVGPVVAMGHIVGTFAGAAAGAAVGGVGLAGAAAASQLSVVLHRHGIPDSALETLQAKVESGAVLLIVQAGDTDEAQRYVPVLVRGADQVMDLP